LDTQFIGCISKNISGGILPALIGASFLVLIFGLEGDDVLLAGLVALLPDEERLEEKHGDHSHDHKEDCLVLDALLGRWVDAGIDGAILDVCSRFKESASTSDGLVERIGVVRSVNVVMVASHGLVEWVGVVRSILLQVLLLLLVLKLLLGRCCTSWS